MKALRTGPRVRAPELIPGDWFNTEPAAETQPALTLAGLRGRFVLLDFWTFCCGNCLHVLDELRPLEAAYGDVLTVIGIHSPKFPHEAEPAALAAAIERYEVHHPVLNDPELALWRQYAVRAWPTLVLIDPEGYVVAQAAGEGQVTALAALLDTLIAEHDTKGTLRHGDRPYQPPAPHPTTLRFPAKVIVTPAARTGRDVDSLLVADAGHHQLVELALDGETVLRRIGTGTRGEPFAEPNGLTLLPPNRAPYDVLVADTANHLLRGVRLADGAVTATVDLPAALAGVRTVTGPVPSVLSPWDVAWWPALDRVVIAAAGVHLLLTLDVDSGQVEILAGTTVEGLRDGPAADAWLAQPSGLAVDGERLWFVDSESSALRSVVATRGTDNSVRLTVETAVGEGLFDFGHVDGDAAQARLQHPLGVTVLTDADTDTDNKPGPAIAVLDTYNGAIRRYDPVTGRVSTLARGLAEPSGAVVVDGELVVIESAAHRLVRPVPVSELIDSAARPVARPSLHIRPGAVELEVSFQPPPGRKLDHRFGPSSRLSISASPPELLAAGAGESVELQRRLEFGPVTEGVLQVTAQVASCDADGADNPACYLARQDWGVPVRLVADGEALVRLILLG